MIEKDCTNYEIAKVLFAKQENFKIINSSFEEFDEKEFDLVIGNPPFGRMRAKTKLDKSNSDL